MRLSSAARKRQRTKTRKENESEHVAPREAHATPQGGLQIAGKVVSGGPSCLICDQPTCIVVADDAEELQTRLKVCPRHFRRLSVLEQRLTKWAMAAPIHDINALHALSLPNVQDWYTDLFLDIKMFGLLVEFLLERGHDPCQEGGVGSPLESSFEVIESWLKDHDMKCDEEEAKEAVGHLHVVAVLGYHWEGGRGSVCEDVEKPILRLIKSGRRLLYPTLDMLRPEGAQGYGELSASDDEDSEGSEEESEFETDEEDESTSEDGSGTEGKRFCECKCKCSHARYNLDSLRALRKRILAKESRAVDRGRAADVKAHLPDPAVDMKAATGECSPMPMQHHEASEKAATGGCLPTPSQHHEVSEKAATSGCSPTQSQRHEASEKADIGGCSPMPSQCCEASEKADIVGCLPMLSQLRAACECGSPIAHCNLQPLPFLLQPLDLSNLASVSQLHKAAAAEMRQNAMEAARRIFT